jgi:RNA methyltransferase, TrmH family
MTTLITSFSNPTIRRLRALADKRGRAAEGLFLAEGLRLVTEAVDAGRVPQILVHGPSVRDHQLLRRIARQTEDAGGYVVETSDDILSKIARKDNPQAVLGAFALWEPRLSALDLRTAPLWLAVEGLKDPGNLGTLLRTADAVGAGGVVLIDQSCDPFSVEAVRASMGALFTVPVAKAAWAAFLSWAKAGDAKIAGAVLDDAVDYQSPRYAAPTIVLMGNEQSGLPADYAAACDWRVKIPMRGKADSLNVAVATAVLAYEVLNQQRSAAGRH